MSILVYGASDDLIEVEGDIREEFPYHDNEGEGDLLAFSGGSVLRIKYDNDGIWRITPVLGAADVSVQQAPLGDVDNYSDRATIRTDTNRWVVQGIGLAWIRGDRQQ